MPALASKLNPRSDDFKANAAAMRALVDDLNAKLAQIALRAAARRRAPSTWRAASCCRATASRCCSTPDTPFLEIAPLAALNMYKDKAASTPRRAPG